MDQIMDFLGHGHKFKFTSKSNHKPLCSTVPRCWGRISDQNGQGGCPQKASALVGEPVYI